MDTMKARVADIKKENKRNSQRLEQQKKRREMEKEIKKTAAAEVQTSLAKFKNKMEKAIAACERKCCKVVTATLADMVTKKVDKAVSPTVRFTQKQQKKLETFITQ